MVCHFAEYNKCMIHEIDLPITITHQAQDGCVTASARSFVSDLGIPFEKEFLPKLKEYSLDPNNPENNHMLGIAIVSAELGLEVVLHRAVPLKEDILPANAPERAKIINPLIIKRIMDLQRAGKVVLSVGQLGQESLLKKLNGQLNTNKYALIILDWDKWNPVAQKKYGNPRHIVTIFGVHGKTIIVQDPSLTAGENPVRTDIEHLYSSLNEKQQILFVGKSKT